MASELYVNTIAEKTAANGVSVDGVTLKDGGATLTGDFVPATPLSHRNMIINGAMQVWQRGEAVATINNGHKKADCWKFGYDVGGSVTCEAEAMSDADFNTTGHRKCQTVKCTGTDTSIAAGHQLDISQWIEAQNCSNLQYGTANAKNITASFWAKGDQTAIYALSLTKQDNTAYAITKEFTVTTSWQQFTITFGSSDANWATTIQTSGGKIDDNNGAGFVLGFVLASGSTFQMAANSWLAKSFTSAYGTSSVENFMDSTSRIFRFTGVQLELGSSATPFEHRSYGDELARCQRYYYKLVDFDLWGATLIMNVGTYHANVTYGGVWFPVEMRDDPAIDQKTGTNYFAYYRAGDAIYFSHFDLANSSPISCRLGNGDENAGTAGNVGWIVSSASGAYLAFSAEL